MNLIVALLAPMFLVASAGDVAFARMAATETINAYSARNHADLIAVAQIVAFGLAALGSLSLSMADDISLSLVLRLRGNANALNRAAEQNRRALRESLPDARVPHPAAGPAGAEPADTLYEANIAAEARLHPQNPEPEAEPSPVPPAFPDAAPTVAAQVMSPRQLQAMWAAAMTDVAEEFTASLPHLPPAERSLAVRRADILTSAAHTLRSGQTV
jgi:hypothetical protein